MKRGFVAGLLALSVLSQAQQLVSVTSTGTLTASDVKAKYQKAFKKSNAPTIQGNAIRLFKTTYRSRLPDGRTTTLSGLVAVPAGGARKGLIVHYHGTLANRDNVPSRYRGEEANGETNLPVLAFATAGYAVALPDYIGLGDHKGFHPFPLNDVNCWSGIDLIKPARQIGQEKSLRIGPKLFISGYSQGGGVAMWAAKELQELNDPEYQLSKSAPLSGPYDYTGAQAKQIVEKSIKPLTVAARVYLAAYLARGIQKNVPGINLNDYFVPSFASYIPGAFDLNLPDQKLIQKLYGKALQLGSVRGLDRITQPKFREALRSGDTSDPIIRKLAENNGYDWSPTIPMYLVCIDGDEVVTPQNTLNTVRFIRKRGVGKSILRHYVMKEKGLNHVTGCGPALILARRFFDGGFQAVPTLD